MPYGYVRCPKCESEFSKEEVFFDEEGEAFCPICGANVSEELEREQRWDVAWKLLSNARELVSWGFEHLPRQPIFPLTCPKCHSFSITVAFGTSSRLECLHCGARYRLIEVQGEEDL